MSEPVLTTSKLAPIRPDLGWPLLPVPDETGSLHWPDLASSVKQMIEVILRTTPGEQLMRPQFGGGLERMIHRPNTVATRARIREAIIESLKRFERRILLDDVQVNQADDPNLVSVAILFRLRNNGQPGAVRANIAVGGGAPAGGAA